jgi:hypothetical protein
MAAPLSIQGLLARVQAVHRSVGFSARSARAPRRFCLIAKLRRVGEKVGYERNRLTNILVLAAAGAHGRLERVVTLRDPRDSNRARQLIAGHLIRHAERIAGALDDQGPACAARAYADRELILLQSWRDVIEQLGGGNGVVIGGKSLGGRMVSMIASGDQECSFDRHRHERRLSASDRNHQ